jgi:PAS domain S-box-containing protein
MATERGTDQGTRANVAATPECRAVFDLVNDGVFVHDMDTGAILDANRRAEVMFGLSREALCGSTIDSLSEGRAPYNQRYALELICRAAAGEPQMFEWRARRSSGELFWVEVNLSRVRLGGADRLLAVVRDITERKRVEDALRDSENRSRRRAEELDAALAEVKRLGAERARDSEARYRALFESMTEGFALLEIVDDPEGRPVDARFIEVNPACERLTGMPRATVIGRRLGEVAPDEREFWIRAYGQVAMTGEPAHVQHRSTVVARDYEVCAFSPRPRQFALLFVDVTDLKRIEREVRDADRSAGSSGATAGSRSGSPS